MPLTNVLIIIFVLFLIFLACRHIVCWYWKINEGIALLKEIKDELKKSNGEVVQKKIV